MLLSIFFLTLLAFSKHISASTVEVFPNTLTKTDSCVEFFLADNFGAGWGGAQLYVFDNTGNARSFSPDLKTGYALVKYCYSPVEGVLSIGVLGQPMLAASYNVNPDFTLTASVQYFKEPSVLSVVWSARILDNGESYSGNHMSSIIFRGDSISLKFNNARNLISSPLSPSTCTACIIGKNRSYRSLHADSERETVSSMSSLTPEMSLYGHDNTWFRSEGFSTTYEITDSDGTSVFYTGMLCNKNNTDGGANVDETFSLPCDIDLSEGDYIWRVNGALDSFKQTVAWEFCSTRGSFSTELHFNIDKNGVCSPNGLRYLPEVIDRKSVLNAIPDDGYVITDGDVSGPVSVSQTPFTLQLAVDFVGLESIQMSRLERALLECAFLSEFEEAKTHDFDSLGNPCATDGGKKRITLLHWQDVITDSFNKGLRRETVDIDTVTTEDGVSDDHSKLAVEVMVRSKMHRLSLTMNVIAEEYGYNVLSEENFMGMKEFVYNFKRYLKLQMESGVFLSRLHQMARSSGFKTLVSAAKVKLGEVKLITEEAAAMQAKLSQKTERDGQIHFSEKIAKLRQSMEQQRQARKQEMSTKSLASAPTGFSFFVEYVNYSADVLIVVSICMGVVLGLLFSRRKWAHDAVPPVNVKDLKTVPRLGVAVEALSSSSLPDSCIDSSATRSPVSVVDNVMTGKMKSE